MAIKKKIIVEEQFNLFDYELENFNSYIQYINSYLEKTLADLLEVYNKGSSEYQIYQYEFTSLFFSSTFISIISFVEINLDRLCKTVKEMNNYSLSYIDLKDKGISRSINYLKKVHGREVQINSIKKEIDKFHYYSKIRHKIVHNDGVVSIENFNIFDQIQTLIPFLEFINYQDEKRIKITHNFLVELLKDIEDLFKKLNSIV